MALKDKITNGARRLGRFWHKAASAYQEGEAAADLEHETRRVPHIESEARAFSEVGSHPVEREITERLDLKGCIADAEREIARLKRECENLRLKLEDSKGKLEVSFPGLVKRLCRMLDNPEIRDILKENGLSLCSDFEKFTDGFMRVKNESIVCATLMRPALVRGEYLVEPGIVHVPMCEDGAEPPKKGGGNGCFEPLPKTCGIEFNDDFSAG